MYVRASVIGSPICNLTEKNSFSPLTYQKFKYRVNYNNDRFEHCICGVANSEFDQRWNNFGNSIISFGWVNLAN